jgi:Predicted metal-dependent hydrolase
MIPYKIVREETDMVMAHVLDNGDVEVHMPYNAPEQMAEDVVQHYSSDIEKQIDMRLKAIAAKKSINYSFQPMLFGKRYPIIKRAGDICEYDGIDKCFYVIPGLRQYQLKNFLKNIYTQIGNDFFSKQLKEIAVRMGVKYKHFQISEQPTPFGSCTNEGEIIELSWSLTMTDVEFVTATIIHELAHTKFYDHYSPEFMDYVKQFYPKYDDVVSRSKDYAIMLRADGWK